MLRLSKTNIYVKVLLVKLMEMSMLIVQGMILKVACNQDLPRLPWLLANYPETVIVRIFAQNDVPVTEFIKKPYLLVEGDKYFVLYGKNAVDDTTVRLRIVNTDSKKNVLQYCNQSYPRWGDWPVEIQLLVPFSVKLSEIGINTL